MRLPPNTNDEVDEDPTGNKALWDRGLLNGASQKVPPSSLPLCNKTRTPGFGGGGHRRIRINLYTFITMACSDKYRQISRVK